MVRTDCIVSSTHKLNNDGYLRVNRGGSRIFMHRLVWIEAYGEIPEDCSVHHKCENRACFNLDHLELVNKSEHASHHNRERSERKYGELKHKAKQHWLETKCSGMKLAEIFGVSFSSTCRWIREWKCRD